MKKQKSRLAEYSYTILLSVSFLIVGMFWQFGGLKEQKPGDVSHFLQDATDEFFSRLLIERSMEAVSAEVVGKEWQTQNTEQVTGMEGIQDEKLPLPGAAGVVQDEAVDSTPVFYQADESYFDDALFIGDSRTVGLYEYGGLGNAEVFAHSGMSIYKIFKEEFQLRSGEEVTLETALQTRQFGKVYIMLGINELGYDFEQTVKKFAETIEMIQAYQPEAIVFIQANLHITNHKSTDSDLFNNENIDKFNRAIGGLADGAQIFYLDVNPLYDDENGALSEEFTTDHAHILGKYYVDWVNFILENAVKRGTI